VPPVQYSERRLGDVMRNYSDTSKAKIMLGWGAKMLLKVGLSKTVKYFKNECAVGGIV